MMSDDRSHPAQTALSTAQPEKDPVCGMDVDRSLSSAYKGKTYYFCTAPHKKNFDDSPDTFVKG